MTNQDEEIFVNGISETDRVWAAAAYAFSPLSPILILLLDDKSEIPFVKEHLMQALTVGALFLLFTLITLGFGAISWIIPLYLAFKAYNGESFQIPILYEFIEKQGWIESDPE
jgi:uncharacterized membrane protein